MRMNKESISLLLQKAESLQKLATDHQAEADRHVKAAEECRVNAMSVADRAALLRADAEKLKRDGQ